MAGVGWGGVDNAQAISRDVLKKHCNDLAPGLGYSKASQTKYCPSRRQRNPSLTSEVLLTNEERTGAYARKKPPQETAEIRASYACES